MTHLGVRGPEEDQMPELDLPRLPVDVGFPGRPIELFLGVPREHDPMDPEGRLYQTRTIEPLGGDPPPLVRGTQKSEGAADRPSTGLGGGGADGESRPVEKEIPGV